MSDLARKAGFIAAYVRDRNARASDDRVEGYLDGGDPASPEPSENRSASYRHGFAVARSDARGQPAFGTAANARKMAAMAEQKDAEQ